MACGSDNSYFLWGPPDESVEVAIIVGFGEIGANGEIVPEPPLSRLFRRIGLARLHRCDRCLRWRNDMPIWIARDPRRPLAEAWPDLRFYE